MRHLLRDTISAHHRTGESASGAATEAITLHAGTFLPLTAAQSRNAQGASPADSGTAYIDATGWGDTWTLEPGDAVTHKGTRYSVLAVSAHTNPRTGVLWHIEVRCG